MSDATTATTAAAEAAFPPKSHTPGWLGRVGDFLNPVLVKEVRQAQRGKVFTVALVATVLITLMASVLMALEIDDDWTRPGRQFFTMIYVFLAGSLMLVVPFQAFSSMGSEWDEHTYEMLVLSNLKPSQIVLGKLFAAGVQGLMLLGLFMPFLAVAFLLRGVDLFVLGFVLVATAFASLWLSSFAIMLSALTRNRLLRVLLMVMLGGGLISVISGAVAMAEESMRRPDQLGGPEFWVFMPQILAMFALLGALTFLMSCNLLAHEEENRSTNIRILTTVTILAFLVTMLVNVTVPRLPLPRGVVFSMTGAAMFILTAFAIFFCSEPERLGRRVVGSVPKGRMAAFLTFPWYPGGGRGIAYLLLHLALLLGGGFVVAMVADRSAYLMPSAGSGDSLLRNGGGALLIIVMYALLYSVVPIAFMSLFLRNTAFNRRIIRALAIASPFFYLTLPAILGLLLNDRSLQSMEHAGNPAYLIERSLRMGGFEWVGSLAVLVAVAAVVIFFSIPKMARSLRETLTAHSPKESPSAGVSEVVENP